MNDDFVLIKEIIIPDPINLLLYQESKKSKEVEKIFLISIAWTANLFYIQNVSYHIALKITHDVKLWLRDKIGLLPELEKWLWNLSIIGSLHIDLDNKIYFFKSYYWIF